MCTPVAAQKGTRILQTASVNNSRCICLPVLKDESLTPQHHIDLSSCWRSRCSIDVQYRWSQISHSTVRRIMAQHAARRSLILQKEKSSASVSKRGCEVFRPDGYGHKHVVGFTSGCQLRLTEV